MPSMQNHGQLFVVATPIGNLEDITPRALDVLKQVDVIAAEDTRHANKLLKHFGIETPMVAYHDHNEQVRSDKIIADIQTGKNYALISDAGTPLISDPGFRVTQAAHQAHIKVTPIVGACAAIAALSVAGLPSDKFSFEGFLPNKSSQRIIKLTELQNQIHTMIFYESPHRVLGSLKDMADVFGEQRKACLCRELTKTFETVKQASISELIQFVNEDNNQQKGEIVIIVDGAEVNTDQIDEHTHKMLTLLLQHLPPKKATAITSELTGIKKNQLYDYALSLKNK